MRGPVRLLRRGRELPRRGREGPRGRELPELVSGWGSLGVGAGPAGRALSSPLSSSPVNARPAASAARTASKVRLRGPTRVEGLGAGGRGLRVRVVPPRLPACTCVYEGQTYHYEDVIYNTTDGLGACLIAICGHEGRIIRTTMECPGTSSTIPFTFTTTAAPLSTTGEPCGHAAGSVSVSRPPTPDPGQWSGQGGRSGWVSRGNRRPRSAPAPGHGRQGRRGD